MNPSILLLLRTLACSVLHSHVSETCSLSYSDRLDSVVQQFLVQVEDRFVSNGVPVPLDVQGFMGRFLTALLHRFVILELKVKMWEQKNQRMFGAKLKAGVKGFVMYFERTYKNYVNAYQMLHDKMREVIAKLLEESDDLLLLSEKLKLFFAHTLELFDAIESHFILKPATLYASMCRLFPFPDPEDCLNFQFISKFRKGKSNQRLPPDAVRNLQLWLAEHFDHPYPSESEKEHLAWQNQISVTQVSYWFINARVRIWRPMIADLKIDV